MTQTDVRFVCFFIHLNRCVHPLLKMDRYDPFFVSAKHFSKVKKDLRPYIMLAAMPASRVYASGWHTYARLKKRSFWAERTCQRAGTQEHTKWGCSFTMPSRSWSSCPHTTSWITCHWGWACLPASFEPRPLSRRDRAQVHLHDRLPSSCKRARILLLLWLLWWPRSLASSLASPPPTRASYFVCSWRS